LLKKNSAHNNKKGKTMKIIDKITETKKAGISGKMKQKALNAVLAASMIATPVAATLPFAACSDDPTPTGTQQNEYTIRAFDKNITVVNTTGGDISAEVNKLEAAWADLESIVTGAGGTWVSNMEIVLNRGLKIVVNSGNDTITGQGDRTINVGVDYLSGNPFTAIAPNISTVIYSNLLVASKSLNLNNALLMANKAFKSKARS
jgi:hypothetical protein